MSTTLSKYVPETEDWRKKHWLYEQYWGELKSTRKIAEPLDVSRATIRKQLSEKNIPQRTCKYQKDNSVSPFTGFYNGNENAQITGDSNSTQDQNEGDYEFSTPNWRKYKGKRRNSA